MKFIEPTCSVSNVESIDTSSILDSLPFKNLKMYKIDI